MFVRLASVTISTQSIIGVIFEARPPAPSSQYKKNVSGGGAVG